MCRNLFVDFDHLIKILKMALPGQREGGKQDFSLSKGAAEDFEFTCQPCADSGTIVEAEGFCQNCQEYLCITCYRYHCRPTPTRDHVLLDKHNMPKVRAPQKSTKQTCTEKCRSHPGEVVKYFCKKHDIVGCGDCIVLEHKTCNVDYITEIADGFASTTECVDVVNKVRQLQEEVSKLNKENTKKEEDFANSYATAVNEINQFRKELNDYLDKIEQNLLREGDKLKQENHRLVKKVTNENSSMKLELDTLQSRLAKTMQSCDLFIVVKSAVSRLHEIEEAVKVRSTRKMNSVKFQRNQVMNDLLSKCCQLGELVAIATVQSTSTDIRCSENKKPTVDMKVTSHEEINVKTSSDKEKCCITGMVAVSSDLLACTDINNKKVKLFITTSNNVVSEISLTNRPWDVTVIPDNQLAVTVPWDKKIQFLTYNRSSLSLGDSINVSGHCNGIAYSKDRLIITYCYPGKVEVMTLKGRVLQSIQTDSKGKNIFSRPQYVATSRDDTCMYVSDFDPNSVIRLAFDGTVLATCTDKESSGPESVIVCSDGSVIVCGSVSHNVHVITADCMKLKVLLSKNDGLFRPYALCYMEDTETLYIGCSGIFHGYKLS